MDNKVKKKLTTFYTLYNNVPRRQLVLTLTRFVFLLCKGLINVLSMKDLTETNKLYVKNIFYKDILHWFIKGLREALVLFYNFIES